MHIEIDEQNPIFAAFNKARIEEGYTTFKSGIIAAIKIFIAQHNETVKKLDEITKNTHVPELTEENLKTIKDHIR